MALDEAMVAMALATWLGWRSRHLKVGATLLSEIPHLGPNSPELPIALLRMLPLLSTIFLVLGTERCK